MEKLPAGALVGAEAGSRFRKREEMRKKIKRS